MSFKEQLNKDAAVFVNIDELGELHDVDGNNIVIVIDEDVLHGRPRQPMELYNTVSGVFIQDKTIYAKSSDFTYRPVVGQHLTLDGDLYIVSTCHENMGILTIVLGANQA